MFVPPLALNEIQETFLNSNTVLLEYLLGDQCSQLWVVTCEEVRIFLLPQRSEIEMLGRELYRALAEQSKVAETGPHNERIGRTQDRAAAYLTKAKDFANLLIGPAVNFLERKRLIVVADGFLQSIPFGALPMPGTDRPLVLTREVIDVPADARSCSR